MVKRASAIFGVELITLGVALLIHTGFIALTLCYARLPAWLFALVGSLLLTWHGSLQHETIHGHPTRSRRFNALLGKLPLSLWIPYRLYRQSHLQHHRHEGHFLTDVDRDPESFYWTASTCNDRGKWIGAINRFNGTLLGRLLLGPALTLARLAADEFPRIVRGTGRRRILWARHAVAISLVLVWLIGVCHIPLAFYLGCLVYPSISLGLLRSYAEHRADSDVRRRTRVVEAGLLWRLLFLNNNLHIAHHAHPDVPWYRLPLVWSTMRKTLRTQELIVTGGYLEVVRRYLLRSALVPHRTEAAPIGPGAPVPQATSGGAA